MENNGMRLCLFLILSRISKMSCAPVAEEPICTSRFGFESDLLRSMIKLEFDTAVMKDKTAEALADLDTLTKKLTEEQTTRLGELKALGDEMQIGVEEKTKLFEKTRTNLANDFAKLYTDFEDKTGAKWKEIQENAIKPPIAFIAKTVFDTSPGTNTMLRFTEVVTNTGNGYDTSTGYFTAPGNGTYSFSVQMCPNPNKYLHIQLFAENTLIANSKFYGNSYSCYTTTAVAVLNAGDKVHVKSGQSSSSGTIIDQDSSRWASFSGFLANKISWCIVRMPVGC